MTAAAATTTRASLALLLALAACGGGGAAAGPGPDQPAAARPARNAAGRPTTREALADLIQGAVMRNAPDELAPLLITEAELRAGCPGLSQADDLTTELRSRLGAVVKACHDEVDWTSTRRLAMWGGHPRPPLHGCNELAADTALDIDLTTHAEPLTLRIELATIDDGLTIARLTCGVRGDDDHLEEIEAAETMRPAELEFERYTNTVCACKDMKCVTDAGAQYAEMVRGRKSDAHLKPSKRMIELVTRMTECTKKITEYEMQKYDPPPP